MAEDHQNQVGEIAEPTFEEAMAELEQIVRRLEESDVPLEEAIDLFQKGVALSKQCHMKLQKVEDQIDRILSEDGKLKPLRFDKEDDE